MTKFSRAIHYIADHPMNKSPRRAGFKRYMRRQLATRLALAPIVRRFANDTELVVVRGPQGTPDDVYTGLHEFSGCSFPLHLLRPSGLFVDCGSNIGVYTVLAPAAIGSYSIAVEPIPF